LSAKYDSQNQKIRKQEYNFLLPFDLPHALSVVESFQESCILGFSYVKNLLRFRASRPAMYASNSSRLLVPVINAVAFSFT